MKCKYICLVVVGNLCFSTVAKEYSNLDISGSNVTLEQGSNVTGDLSGGGNIAQALVTRNGAVISGDNITFNATGVRAYGLNSLTGSTINLTGTTVSNATSPTLQDYSIGVSGIGGTVNIEDLESTVFGNVDQTYGISIYNNGTVKVNNATIVSNGGGITAYGTSAVTAGSANITAGNNYGLYANQNSRIEISKGAVISNTGNRATVYANNGSTIDLTDTHLSNADTGNGIVSTNGSTVNLKGGTINTNTTALTASNNATVNASGKLEIVGDISTDSTSTISINATDKSLLVGAVDNKNITNISLDNGSVWEMTKDSNVSSLTLNNSTVDLTKGDFKTITTDKLDGNGNFSIKTDIANQQADTISVLGTATGSHTLTVNNQGSAETTGNEKVVVVKTGNNEASWGLANRVELGGYEYNLRPQETDSNNYELYSSGKVTSTASAATSTMNVNYLTTYIENQTLLQRMGDLRNSSGTSGFWMRAYGGKLSAFGGDGLQGFDMSYTGLQLGIDKSFDVDTGKFIVGIMASHTRSNPNYREGDGTGKSYSAGVYGTYLDNSGLYIDTTLRYVSMRNHFNVNDTQGVGVKGTSKTNGVTASFEVGKRFIIGTTNFYVEPQAQLSYGYQSGDSIHASNDLKVSVSGYNSTIGRVSGIVGYQIQGENPINLYVKTGVVREFSGGTSYRFNNGRKNGYTFRSSWFDNGIGANININKKHNIYAEADYSTGGRFDNAMLNIGYRYNF